MKQSILFVIIFSASVLFVHASEPTRFRGAMFSPHHFHESDLQVLGESWNANVVRWQLNLSFPHGEADKANVEDYYSWLESECKLLDTTLPFLRASGVKVCLDMHTSEVDWIYHAFREWEGWSLEYPEDKTADAPAVGPTPRQLLLRAYFEKNIRVID